MVSNKQISYNQFCNTSTLTAALTFADVLHQRPIVLGLQTRVGRLVGRLPTYDGRVPLRVGAVEVDVRRPSRGTRC